MIYLNDFQYNFHFHWETSTSDYYTNPQEFEIDSQNKLNTSRLNLTHLVTIATMKIDYTFTYNIYVRLKR